jgi:hypothetical protein
MDSSFADARNGNTEALEVRCEDVFLSANTVPLESVPTMMRPP